MRVRVYSIRNDEGKDLDERIDARRSNILGSKSLIAMENIRIDLDSD